MKISRPSIPLDIIPFIIWNIPGGLWSCVALDLLQEIPANALPTSHRDSVEVLQQLTEAWQAWDLFHHTQAADIFKKIDTVPDYLKEFAFNKGNLSTLINLGKALSPDKAHAKPSFTPDVLADLYTMPNADSGRQV